MDKIKLFLKKIYEIRYYILVFSFLFLIFFRAFFPDTTLINFIFHNLSTNSSYLFDHKDTELNFFPSLGIESSYLKAYKKNGSSFIFNNTSINIPLLSLLFFSPEVEFEGETFDGSIEAYISDVPLVINNNTNFLFSIVLEKINLASVLKNVIPKYLNLDITSNLAGTIDGEVFPLSTKLSKINLNLSFDKIHLFPTKIMNIEIPEIKLKKGFFKGAVIKSVLNIEKLVLGSKKEDLFLSLTGKIALTYNKPYDFRIKISSKGKVKDILDLSLLSLGAKEKNGMFTFRAVGDTKNPIPEIKPE